MITDKKALDALLQVQHHFAAGMYCKLSWLERGRPVAKHKHSFDHDSVLVIGKVELDVDGHRSVIEGPVIVPIRANRAHTVTPLTDALWACVHETDETDPEKIDHVLMEKGG